MARPRSVRSQPPKWQLTLRSQHGHSREAEVLQLLASGRLPQPRLSFRSRVSRGASSDPLHARGVFSPHPSLSTTSRCACRMSCTGDAQSIRGASSGPLHARGVFPLTLVYHQDVHAASGMRAAPVMRSHSFSTIQDVYAALDMRATYCHVCSIRLHQPGCVRRIVASYILVVYVSAASSGRHTLTRIA